MIYSASSLFLATLVFNAASVWGAPVPVSSDGSPVVRSTGDDSLPRRWTVIDVPPRVRSVDPEQVDARDTASSSSASIEARDPLPEVERIVRRFPRKVYQDYYTKRSPTPDDESLPVARSPEVVERRFPRRALYERHEERSNPAPEARSEQAEPADIQRRYPRKVYADYYQKRESSPPTVVEAREPAPELTDSGRRFPRQVLAERYVKRQDDAAAATPPADPAAPPAADPVVPPVAPTASTSATVSASASTATATSPNVPPLDLNRIVKDITSGDLNSFQPGTTIKETTLLVNKITHISDKGNAAQNAPVVPPVAAGTPASPATPASSSAAASPTSTAATGDVPVTPPVAAAPAPESTTTPPVDPAAPPAAPADGANPPAEGGASRRSVGSVIRRQLGYSGPTWASHLKRNVN